MQDKKIGFLALVPLLIFVFVYLGTGMYLYIQKVEMAFYQFPSPIAIFIGIIFAFIIFGGTINEKFNNFLEGCGHQDIITMCIIYLLAGAFASVSKAMGGVDSTVNFGLTYIPAHYITAGLFVIASFISTATGTSVGSIVAITPIAIGLVEKGGLSMPLVLAAVMGGSMFGDNLSVISDTTIAATKTQGVEMRDKFKVNLFMAIPASILTIILLLIFGKPETITNIESLDYNFIKILPYIAVLILAIVGVNVFVVLTSGIIFSGIVGIVFGNFTILSFSKEIYNGFVSMNEIFFLSLLTGGLATMTQKAGGIEWVIEKVKKLIIGTKTAKIGIGILVAIADAALANNTIAIIINGDIAKNIANKYKVDLRISASVMDIFSCVMQGLIPYGAQMLILLGFAKGVVSPIEIIPLLWYQGLLLLFTILYIVFSIDDKIVSKINKK